MLSSSDQQKLHRFQEVLTVRLINDFYGTTTVDDRAATAKARAEVEHLQDHAAYFAAVDAAHREQTACMVARWATPRRS
jgi:hypothetical protein